MYTRTQQELTDPQKYMASLSTVLSFFRPRNLKSVFRYLFIIVSSQNVLVRCLPFPIAIYTLLNYETTRLKVTKRISLYDVINCYTKTRCSLIACGWQMLNDCMGTLFQKVVCRLLVIYTGMAVPDYVQTRNTIYAIPEHAAVEK